MHSWAMRGASAPSAHVDLGIDSIGKAELINHTMLDYTADGVFVGAGEYLAFGKLTVSAHSSFAFWVSPTGGSSPATLYALRNSATGAELRLGLLSAVAGECALTLVETYAANLADNTNSRGHTNFVTSTSPMPSCAVGGWCLVTVVTAPPLLSLYVDGSLALEVRLSCFLDQPYTLFLPHPLTRYNPIPCRTPYLVALHPFNTGGPALLLRP
eukprot:scaffold97846_cov63-Phaeocystis_antarctica.AAC.3